MLLVLKCSFLLLLLLSVWYTNFEQLKIWRMTLKTIRHDGISDAVSLSSTLSLEKLACIVLILAL
uniref:Uncharacterized protein n=1 Tax=Hucho hucho TaxID=62062 RepID=A0A4W5Q3L6_9TELE